MADSDFDTALQRLREQTEDPEATLNAIVTLAEAGSQSSAARERLAAPEVLQALLNLLDSSLRVDRAVSPSLPFIRCIGNACVDNDAARQIVTDHGFSWTKEVFASGLQDVDLKVTAFSALHNVCLDFEPAQRKCCEEGVHEDALRFYLRDLLKGDGEWAKALGSMVATWLLSVCEKRETGHPLGDDASREHLLDFPHALHNLGLDADDFAAATEAALIYLREERQQEKFIRQQLIEKVWTILEDCEDFIAKEEDPENVQLLVPLSTSLTWCLSDIAASPEFAEVYAGREDFVRGKVFDAIQFSTRRQAVESESPRLASAACQVLGNLLWSLKGKSSSTPEIDVVDADLHAALMDLSSAVEEADTLYPVTGLLIQMCRYSEEYKTKLCGDERLSAVLTCLCESESKEVRQAGMKLLQLLGKDNSAVRERFAGLAKQVMESLVPEQSSSQEQQQLQQNGSVVEVPD